MPVPMPIRQANGSTPSATPMRTGATPELDVENHTTEDGVIFNVVTGRASRPGVAARERA
jgi:hypothetical protein